MILHIMLYNNIKLYQYDYDNTNLCQYTSDNAHLYGGIAHFLYIFHGHFAGDAFPNSYFGNPKKLTHILDAFELYQLLKN